MRSSRRPCPTGPWIPASRGVSASVCVSNSERGASSAACRLYARDFADPSCALQQMSWGIQDPQLGSTGGWGDRDDAVKLYADQRRRKSSSRDDQRPSARLQCVPACEHKRSRRLAAPAGCGAGEEGKWDLQQLTPWARGEAETLSGRMCDSSWTHVDVSWVAERRAPLQVSRV